MKPAREISAPCRRRRVQRSARDIQAILAQYRTAGLTQQAFAKSRSLSLSTFAYWLRKERIGGTEHLGRPPRLVPVRIAEPTVSRLEGSGAFELELPHGGVLRIPQIFSAAALRDLLGILSERC